MTQRDGRVASYFWLVPIILYRIVHSLLSYEQWVKKSTFKFEVVLRVRLKLKTVTLILKPQDTVFSGGLN